MATYNPGAIFEVAVNGEFDDKADVVNVYQMIMKDGANVPFADIVDDLLEYFDDLYNLVNNICNLLTVWRSIRVGTLDGDEVSGNVAFSSPILGQLTNNAEPAGAAALITLPTGISRVSMRKYYGVLDDSAIDTDGGLTAGAITSILPAATFLLAEYQATNQRWQYGYKSPKTASWVEPNSYSIWVEPAYQRRRRPGTGS